MRSLIVCYLCGREFGSASISIHEPQCIEKYQLAQSKLEKSKRKPVPARPSNWDQICSGDVSAIKEAKEQYNMEAEESFNNERATCEHCGRGFHPPERLQVHLVSCGPNSHFAKQAQKKKSQAQLSDPNNSSKKSPSNSQAPPSRRQEPKMSRISPKSSQERLQPQAQTSSAAFCTACGVKFPSQANFCGNCGGKRVAAK